jgi:hypothetical protein
VYQFSSHLQRQAGFAHTRGAGEREQVHVWVQEQRVDCLYLVLTANELCE